MTRTLAWLASVRLRALFRGAFLLLTVATLAMALYLLREEKELSYRNYGYGFRKNAAQITATLRHPTGQLALLNPAHGATPTQALHPVLLPYSALDFDDQWKVQQAVEMAGCLAAYKDDAALCIGIGNSAFAGAFIYVAGYFLSGELVAHNHGDEDFSSADRARVSVTLRDATYRWIAPFETLEAGAAGVVGKRGRLTGFIESDSGHGERPQKDFRGWIWQSARCAGASDTDSSAPCAKRSFFSMRLPVPALRDALIEQSHAVWPPADLNDIAVHIEILGATGETLFDSNGERPSPGFVLQDLTRLLQPHETLRIERINAGTRTEIARLEGAAAGLGQETRWLTRLIAALPVAAGDAAPHVEERVVTPGASFAIIMDGSLASVDQNLGLAVTRLAWFEGAMLLCIGLAWLVIEVGIIRRITLLKRRAEGVGAAIATATGPGPLEFADLKGGDELGILATALSELLQRVRSDARREQNRLEQEKDMWNAVGHEIMSPLQSLLALHGGSSDASERYIRRMQQAIGVLYGSASPSEAFESTRLQLQSIELGEFLSHVADNAHFVGIEEVDYLGPAEPVWVLAHEYSLEDVITHVLRNAERFRVPATRIEIALASDDSSARVSVTNQGPQIARELIDRIFEYGVSGDAEGAAAGSRGQGLFVARTYMAKMGGTIEAQNHASGVRFVLTLPRTLAPRKESAP